MRRGRKPIWNQQQPVRPFVLKHIQNDTRGRLKFAGTARLLGTRYIVVLVDPTWECNIEVAKWVDFLQSCVTRWKALLVSWFWGPWLFVGGSGQKNIHMLLFGYWRECRKAWAEASVGVAGGTHQPTYCKGIRLMVAGSARWGWNFSLIRCPWCWIRDVISGTITKSFDLRWKLKSKSPNSALCRTRRLNSPTSAGFWML